MPAEDLADAAKASGLDVVVASQAACCDRPCEPIWTTRPYRSVASTMARPSSTVLHGGFSQ